MHDMLVTFERGFLCMQECKDVHANCLLTITCLRQFLPSGLLNVTRAGEMSVCLECLSNNKKHP